MNPTPINEDVGQRFVVFRGNWPITGRAVPWRYCETEQEAKAWAWCYSHSPQRVGPPTAYVHDKEKAS